MSSHDDPIRTSVHQLVFAGDHVALRDDEVLLRSWKGRIAASEQHIGLPRRLRTLLLLVDGLSTVAELRVRLHRFRSLDESLDMLLRMGLIERLPAPLDL